MQRAERELPRGADESTRAGKSIPLETISHGDGATISPGESDYPKEIRSLGWESYRLHDTPGIQGWTSGSRRDLEERAHHAVTIADIGLLCFDTQNQQDGEFPSATTHKTHGSADWHSGCKGR